MGNWKLVLPHPYRSYLGVLPRDDGKPGPYNHAVSGLELYDLRRDPGEQYNVIDRYPDVAGRLQKIADEARLDLGDDLTGARGHKPTGSGQNFKCQLVGIGIIFVRLP